MQLRSHPVLSAALIVVTAVHTRAQTREAVTEVVIEGHGNDRRSSRDASANSTVLRRDDISQPGSSTANAVARAPGAQVQRSGGSSEPATLSLRGASAAQLPIYLGTSLLNDELTGAVDLALVTPFFIERIEIYRGHAPLFSDRLGLAGAVVLEPRLPKRTGYYAGTMAGSYGATSLYAGAASGNANASSIFAVQRTAATNDFYYLDNRGTVTDTSDDRRTQRRNADSETLDVWTSGHYRPSPSTRLRWLFHGLGRDQGVTGLSVIPAEFARAKTRHELSALTASVACGTPSSDCSLEVRSSWQSTTFGLEDPYFELGYGSNRVDVRAARASQRIRLVHDVSSRWKVGWLAGGDIGTLWVTNGGSAGLRATRHSGLFGVDSTLRVADPLTLLAVGRSTIDRTDDGSADAKSDRFLSGRIGARFDVTPTVSIMINLGRYGRPPTLAELYGTSATLRGNPALRPEQGVAEDLGLVWRWTAGNLRGQTEAVVYHQRTEDLVAWQRTSFGQVRPFNVGRARLLGAELSAASSWKQALRFEATAGLLDPRDTTPSRIYVNDILPYRARLTGNLRFEAALPRALAVPYVHRASAGATWFFRSSRYSVPAGNAVMPGSASLDLDGRVTFALVPLTVRLSVTNVLDRQTYDLLGMPLPGRAFYLAAELNWEMDR